MTEQPNRDAVALEIADKLEAVGKLVAAVCIRQLLSECNDKDKEIADLRDRLMELELKTE